MCKLEYLSHILLKSSTQIYTICVSLNSYHILCKVVSHFYAICVNLNTKKIIWGWNYITFRLVFQENLRSWQQNLRDRRSHWSRQISTLLRLHPPLRGSGCRGGTNARPTRTPQGIIVEKHPEIWQKTVKRNLTSFDGNFQAFPPVRLNAVKKVEGDGPSVTERYMQVSKYKLMHWKNASEPHFLQQVLDLGR